MHERTRKLLCQLIFVFGCALPTLLTMSTIVVRTTPWFDNWRRDCMQAELQDRFGLRFEIAQLKVLAPGAMQLDDVRISDPETGSLVASIREVQCTSREGRVAMLLHWPEVQASQLPHAWNLVHDRFLCHPDLTTSPVRIAAKDLSIHSTGNGITLTDFQAYMQPHDFANETITQFKIAGRDMATPATISITRDRSRQQPETSWKLHTGGAPLPYAILSDYFPQLPELGAACEFNGLINCRFDNNRWNVDLGGSHITGVEVSRVFDSLAHKLTGTADIWFGQCRIERGLLAEVSGGIAIRDGQIGDSLMQSAQRMIGVQSLVSVGNASYRFDLMRMHFALDESGWRFIGACEAENPNLSRGILAMDAGRPLALLTTPQPIAASIPKQMVAPHFTQPLFVSEGRQPILNMLPSQPMDVVFDHESPPIPRVTMRQD